MQYNLKIKGGREEVGREVRRREEKRMDQEGCERWTTLSLVTSINETGNTMFWHVTLSWSSDWHPNPYFTSDALMPSSGALKTSTRVNVKLSYKISSVHGSSWDGQCSRVGEGSSRESVVLPSSERAPWRSLKKSSEAFPKTTPLWQLCGRRLRFAEGQQSCWGIIWLMC